MVFILNGFSMGEMLSRLWKDFSLRFSFQPSKKKDIYNFSFSATSQKYIYITEIFRSRTVV